MGVSGARLGRALRFTAAVGVLAAALLAGWPARPALAAPGESISRYDVRAEVRADGQIRVTETIRYDFGDQQRHGIYREIPTTVRYDGTRDRTYPIGDFTVTMDGQDVQKDSWIDGAAQMLQIGDPDHTVTGTHTYVIGYTVRGMLNDLADHEELYWNAIGTEWTVPIDAATVVVTGPATIGRVDCFTGARGSTRTCAGASADGSTATFEGTALGGGSALTVVVAFPKGSISGTGPILVERHDPATAFRATPATVGGAVGLALVGVAGALAAAWWFGRDRYYVGQLPGLVPESGEPAVERRKPLLGAPPVSVEFGPPEGVRPGQVGALVDERADAVDVTATIIDLAVRGHLHIAEIRRPGASRPDDWELTKLTEPDSDFHYYEDTVFGALFAGGDQVRLSKLKGTVGASLREARGQLDSELVVQGWYRRSPARTRRRARWAAVLILLAALGITTALAVATHVALLGVGLVVGAVALLVVAGRFPARTGRGSAALARAEGFRLYLATAEAAQIRFQEREQIFSRYLPYAMVFGLAGRWARVFGELGVLGATGAAGATGLYWFTGAPGMGPAQVNHAIDGLTATTAAAVSTGGGTSSSSSGGSGFSGGFSGGGGGGGGGGSW